MNLELNDKIKRNEICEQSCKVRSSIQWRHLEGVRGHLSPFNSESNSTISEIGPPIVFFSLWWPYIIQDKAPMFTSRELFKVLLPYKKIWNDARRRRPDRLRQKVVMNYSENFSGLGTDARKQKIDDLWRM